MISDNRVVPFRYKHRFERNLENRTYQAQSPRGRPSVTDEEWNRGGQSLEDGNWKRIGRGVDGAEYTAISTRLGAPLESVDDTNIKQDM